MILKFLNFAVDVFKNGRFTRGLESGQSFREEGGGSARDEGVFLSTERDHGAFCSVDEGDFTIDHPVRGENE